MLNIKVLISLFVVFVLSGCGGGGGAGGAPSTVASSDPNAAPALVAMTDSQAQGIALKLWRDDDLVRHPKGSCAGCHGADFFDLARINSTDTDIKRRAILDGATEQEAQALVQAVKKLRGDASLPPVNARTFRPFQPGGEVLLANVTDAEHVVPVKRDIAFGEQLKPLLPTLFGSRIDSLSKAKRARDELLDLTSGTNKMGANPNKLNLRKLPTGVVYPRWSADVFHGASEGTFNDWIADIAHDAKPERRAEWLALQDKYLADPSNLNFWKMYFAARDMTRLPLLGACSVVNLKSPSACGITDDFNKNKFLSSLIGQHMLRLQNLGADKLDSFMPGPIAFSYLDTDPVYAFMKAREGFPLLPSNLWEIGDTGRVMLESTQVVGSFKSILADLGYPLFAQNSIDPLRSAGDEMQSLRQAWFWIGFTFDPSFARISKSNASQWGEYMVGSLLEDRMFNHMALSQITRLVTRGNLPEANVTKAPWFTMNYRYAWGYNRTVLSKLWNESRNVAFPAALKTDSQNLFAALTGNGFRMSMYLQLEAFDDLAAMSAADAKKYKSELVGVREDLTNTGALAMKAHFDAHHAATAAADKVLIDSVMAKLAVTSTPP